MARALLILANDFVRSRALQWIAKAPVGTRVEFKGPQRTLPQNDRMWAMLTDISRQKEHCGRRYTTDRWKLLFLHALGKETEFMPSLDGRGFLPVNQSSSDLSKEEMSDMIECMFAWGAENDIEWSEPALPGLPSKRGKAA